MALLKVTINRKSYKLTKSFEKLQQLGDLGLDPFQNYTRNTINSLNHEPVWIPSGLDIIRIIHVGMDDCDLSLEELGNYIVTKGVNDFADVATEYLTLYLSDKPDKPVSGSRDKKN